MAQLNDKRSLVVEYKGGQFKGTDDVKGKETLGRLWAEKSGCLFLVAWRKDADGSNVRQQINRTLAS